MPRSQGGPGKGIYRMGMLENLRRLLDLHGGQPVDITESVQATLDIRAARIFEEFGENVVRWIGAATITPTVGEFAVVEVQAAPFITPELNMPDDMPWTVEWIQGNGAAAGFTLRFAATPAGVVGQSAARYADCRWGLSNGQENRIRFQTYSEAAGTGTVVYALDNLRPYGPQDWPGFVSLPAAAGGPSLYVYAGTVTSGVTVSCGGRLWLPR